MKNDPENLIKLAGRIKIYPNIVALLKQKKNTVIITKTQFMTSTEWKFIFKQIKSFYKIIAFDNNAEPPIRFYLSPKSAKFAELTKTILVDFHHGAIYPPQRMGSFTARWCPVIDIKIYQGDFDQIWERIFTLDDIQLEMLHWFTKNVWSDYLQIPEFDAMRLVDFMPFIRQTPFQYQTFDVKRANWISIRNTYFLNETFGSGDENATITISRNDLFNTKQSLEIFITTPSPFSQNPNSIGLHTKKQQKHSFNQF